MNRKEALHLVTGLAGSAMLPFGLGHSASADQWLTSFEQRWETAVAYSLSMLEAMPEEDMMFQPIPEQKAFGLHFTHVGYWNAYYAGSISGTPPPEEPKDPDKAAIKEYVTQTSMIVTNLIRSIEGSDLHSKDHKGKELWGKHAAYWKEHTVADFLLRAYMHTTHHRGQIIVYLRLKGIKPPSFQF
ncbi:MAG: DinB family protein [Bacteroidota bacterium]